MITFPTGGRRKFEWMNLIKAEPAKAVDYKNAGLLTVFLPGKVQLACLVYLTRVFFTVFLQFMEIMRNNCVTFQPAG